MTAMRRAALILHALQPGDREWMLTQLDPQQRSGLRSLLAELAELGVVSDPLLVREAVGHEALLANDEPVSTIAAIAAAPAHAAATVLAGEPAAVVAVALSLHEWPWHGALLDTLGNAKRAHVESLIAKRTTQERHDVGHALRGAMLEELEQRLNETRQQVAQIAPSGWFAQFSRWRSVRRSA